MRASGPRLLKPEVACLHISAMCDALEKKKLRTIRNRPSFTRDGLHKFARSSHAIERHNHRSLCLAREASRETTRQLGLRKAIYLTGE